MENNEMDFDRWYECLEEFCEGLSDHVQEKYDKDITENPTGSGGFGFIRSATKKKALVYRDSAEYNRSCNRWFEYITSGFSCGADADYEDDWYALDRKEFDRKHPRISYKEAYYRFTYGDTRDKIAEAMFLLIEQNEGKHRKFSFNLKNISKQEFQKHFEAIEHWHYTGELDVAPYSGEPAYGPWQSH